MDIQHKCENHSLSHEEKRKLAKQFRDDIVNNKDIFPLFSVTPKVSEWQTYAKIWGTAKGLCSKCSEKFSWYVRLEGIYCSKFPEILRDLYV